MGEVEDDVMHRRRIGTATLAAGGSTDEKSRLSLGTKVFLIAALVIGVAVAIWFAGKPAGNQVDAVLPMGGQPVWWRLGRVRLNWDLR